MCVLVRFTWPTVVNCSFKRCRVDTGITSNSPTSFSSTWWSQTPLTWLNTTGVYSKASPLVKNLWQGLVKTVAVSHLKSMCVVLHDDSAEEQQLCHFGVSRGVSLPRRAVSVGLSGCRSVLHRPERLMHQQRMEVWPDSWLLLLRPSLRVHPGLLPRLWDSLSRWVCADVDFMLNCWNILYYSV